MFFLNSIDNFDEFRVLTNLPSVILWYIFGFNYSPFTSGYYRMTGFCYGLFLVYIYSLWTNSIYGLTFEEIEIIFYYCIKIIKTN